MPAGAGRTVQRAGPPKPVIHQLRERTPLQGYVAVCGKSTKVKDHTISAWGSDVSCWECLRHQ